MEKETEFLSTSRAAKRMGITKGQVRSLCGKGKLSGAYQERSTGPWRIPNATVNDWIKKNKSRETGESTIRDTRPRLTRVVNVALKTISVLIAVMAFLGIISIISDFDGAVDQIQQWGLIRAFPSAKEGETLIVVASFNYSEGIAQTQAHSEIQQAIQELTVDMDLRNLRVEVEPKRLRAGDRINAKKLGNKYNAGIIIWGEDTGVRVTVNFLNLKHPEFVASDVVISETERTQVANPSDYSRFITTDLPSQLTFLSFFAIGQSFYSIDDYEQSVEFFGRAVDSIDARRSEIVGLDVAYFYLGWIHATPLEDPQTALAYYDKAIEIGVPNPYTYFNRGVVRDDLGDHEGSIADYSTAIQLQPYYANAYTNRGEAQWDLGNLDEALSDFTRAIELNPLDSLAYSNRGLVRYEKGLKEDAISNFTAAISDFTAAISIDPNRADLFANRGRANHQLENFEEAISDYTKAIEIDPEFLDYYLFRGLSRAENNFYDVMDAIADFTKVIDIDPSYAEAYLLRGVAHQALGSWQEAITDFRSYLNLRPEAENREQIIQMIDEMEELLSP